MTEDEAKTVAGILHGKATCTGGNVWTVVFDRGDSVVELSEDMVAKYDDWGAYQDADILQLIDF